MIAITRRRALQFAAAASAAIPTSAHADSVRIVVFGASNAAGGGRAHVSGRTGAVGANENWPAKLEQGLRAKGWDVAVINQSVPGRTAGTGVALVDQLPAANLVIVELGVNDYWNSTSPPTVAGYLGTIVSKLRARGSAVILLRQWPPPDDGNFAAVMQSVNAFVAPGLGLSQGFHKGPLPQYDSGDGEHFNAAGNEVFASRVVPEVERVLTQSGFKPAR
jgi:lysophospholipase L1-like esterase